MPRKTQKRTPKRKVARRSKKGSKRTKRRSSKKIKRVLSSTYGIGNLMKIDQKDKITSSGPYHLKKFLKKIKKDTNNNGLQKKINIKNQNILQSHLISKEKKRKNLPVKQQKIHSLLVLIQNHLRKGVGLNM